jgi:hypothetical protein
MPSRTAYFWSQKEILVHIKCTCFATKQQTPQNAVLCEVSMAQMRRTLPPVGDGCAQVSGWKNNADTFVSVLARTEPLEKSWPLVGTPSMHVTILAASLALCARVMGAAIGS